MYHKTLIHIYGLALSNDFSLSGGSPTGSALGARNLRVGASRRNLMMRWRFDAKPQSPVVATTSRYPTPTFLKRTRTFWRF